MTDHTGKTTSYGYSANGLGFLTSAVESGGGDSYAYAYDLMGNRTSETVNGQTTTASFNDANQLVSRGGVTFTYDGAGNMTGSSGGHAFTYNSKNQTTTVQTPVGAITSTITYLGATQVERTYAGEGKQIHHNLLGIARWGTSTSYTRDPEGRLLASHGTRGYYLTDGMGSIAAVTDDAGNLVRTWRYEPYGRVKATTGSHQTPFSYKGETTYHTDHQTGLIHVGHRYYDPQLGRWTQLDPLEHWFDVGDWNAYRYSASDPLNLADPSGEFVRSIGKILGGSLLVASGAIVSGLGVVVYVACIRVAHGWHRVHCVKPALLLISAGNTGISIGAKYVREGWNELR